MGRLVAGQGDGPQGRGHRAVWLRDKATAHRAVATGPFGCRTRGRPAGPWLQRYGVSPICLRAIGPTKGMSQRTPLNAFTIAIIVTTTNPN
jgi:hypothetical protein